jgi:hypothetical protein
MIPYDLSGTIKTVRKISPTRICTI